jgi:hypothetical protein
MRKIPLVLLLALPTNAFASGGEALTLLWLELILLAIVVGSLIFLKLPFRFRLGVLLAYCLGQVIAFSLVGSIPYSQHHLVVNLVSIAVPLAAWLAALLLARRSCKPNNSFKRTPNGAA